MTAREKWTRFLSGEDVGTMVSPLCDGWCADVPYKWTLDYPEPFSQGDPNFILSQQIEMAERFQWDPLFLAAIDFKPNNRECKVEVRRKPRDNGVTRVTSTIKTPLGDLVKIEDETDGSLGLIKDYLDEEDDFRKMLWYTEQMTDFDEADALAQGTKIKEAVGQRGMLGTWLGTSAKMAEISVLFYHIMDYPELFEELFEARKKMTRKQVDLYRKAGFDYLFYVIPGTEWISPDFFREWMYDEVKDTIEHWRSMGGFTVWHTCGLEKIFMEEGFYNEIRPDIFETLSEPPVGNLPSLEWGRKQLRPDIITKGNIPLDVALYGTPEQMREKVRYVKDSTKGYRHIIGFSDNILPNTPCENLRAFVEEARK